MHFEPHFFLHRTFKTHYKALCNKSEIIAGRSAWTDSHSTESAIATCGMPKFRKPRRNLIDLKNRRKVDFKVDYSSLRDPYNVITSCCPTDQNNYLALCLMKLSFLAVQPPSKVILWLPASNSLSLLSAQYFWFFSFSSSSFPDVNNLFNSFLYSSFRSKKFWVTKNSNFRSKVWSQKFGWI